MTHNAKSRPAPAPAPTRVATPPQITVLDWGIGGVALLARVRAARPDIGLRYRSDSGHAPWGSVPTRRLSQRLALIIAQERAAGATGVLIACNAASTVLGPTLRALRQPHPVHGVHGVIVPGCAAVLRDGWQHVGLVGGVRTVRSGAWARPLRAQGLRVRQRVAQPLSARIEQGDVDGPTTRALIRDLCRPLRRCEAVILACTHYPAALAGFAAALPGVALIDPAEAAVAALLAALPAPIDGAASDGAASDGAATSATTWRALTSGDPVATRQAARRAFGVDLGKVDKINNAGDAGDAGDAGR